MSKNPPTEPISRKDALSRWLACLVDSEGCIAAYAWKQTNPAYRGSRALRVSVTIYNTHPLLIEEATKVLCELGIKFCMTPHIKPNPSHKPGIAIVVVGFGRVVRMLSLMLPYLTAKRRRAELVLELVAYRESLAIAGRNSKGRFGDLRLWEDPKLLWYVAEIKRETNEYPSVLEFSRKANCPFGESSTTVRLPQAA